jgi:hypothetical protein
VRPAVLLALLALIGAILLRRWLIQTPRSVVMQHLRRIGIALAIGTLLFLIASGRLPWIVALLGTAAAGISRLLPLLRFAPLFQRLWGYHRPKNNFRGTGVGSSPPPNRSTVESRFVRITLDHGTGEMIGEILEGIYTGKSIQALDLYDLAQLLLECQAADEESAALVRAYLERVYGEDWQAKVNAQARHRSSASHGEMRREEAYQILGLGIEASEQEIIAAHRRLMQKVHPDHGGSDYLAAIINQAKDLLLGKSS